METTPTNLFERLNNWIKESITIKLMSIGFLILILLIPSSWIESLIAERQIRAESVITEISDKWSGEQTVTGPILIIPFVRREKIDKGKQGIEVREHKEKAFFLPEKLVVNGKVNPQVLHRGIFEAAVYESAISMNSKFGKPDFEKLKIERQDVRWGEAYLVVGINDLRGISKNPTIKAGIVPLTSEPSNQIGVSTQFTVTAKENAEGDRVQNLLQPEITESGIISPLNWKEEKDFVHEFSITVGLRGSHLLYFVPSGKTTDVTLSGNWQNPSFTGNFSPLSREVNEKGFTAHWEILHYNRPFAQQWVGEGQRLSGSEFGVKLLIPVGQYQKSMRTAKYGVLVIVLTFVALFMVEIMRKVRIHPFQYILVGAALIIYYSLLLSFSEHLGYDVAYLISSVATVALIGFYSVSFLIARKLSLTFSVFLAFFYLFIFVIIQLQDYSLLLGSIGLFLIIALIMYFSKNIKWYKEE
jgi:inner membrane protein